MEKKMEVVEGKLDWKGRPARKGKHGGNRASFVILGLNTFESFAMVGVSVNLVTYFVGVMHMELATASNTLTNLLGTSYLLAVLFAYLADAYVGRCRITLLFSFSYFVGFVLMTVQAHFPGLRPPPCNIFLPGSQCEKVSGMNAAFLYVSIYLVGLGQAGLKAGLPPHGADQYDENDPDEATQMSSYFNWFLLSTCLGGTFSLTLGVWIQTDVGWDWGFGVASVSIFLGTLAFASSIPISRFHVVRGANPVTEIIQVWVACIRNRKLELPESADELYELDRDKESGMKLEFQPHRNMFRFLDMAAIQTTSAEQQQPPNPWKLCRVTQVEHAKTILGMVPIFGSAIIMSTCLAQLQTFTVQQGVTMDTSIGSIKVPPASLPIIPVFFLVVIVPIYDQIIVPFLRSRTGRPTGITHLQRVGIGLVLSCLSMSAAAIMEVKRKSVAESHGMLDAIPMLQPLPISCFWLSFQYFIFGIADMFTYVGLLEFFYSEAPKKLKSMASSFLWCALSMGYFFSTILVHLVNFATKNITSSRGWLAGNNLNRNHLNLFYWLLAVLSFINFLNYLFWASRYEYKENHAENDEA